LNPAFSSEHIKRLVRPFWSKACELTAVLAREGAKSEDKGGYNVVQVLTRTTLDIIGLAGIRILLKSYG